VDILLKFKDAIPQAYRAQTDPYFTGALNKVAKDKKAAGLQDQADYIQSKLAEEKK